MSRYLFFDIDGTLAGESRRILESTKQAVKEARDNGNRVFVCTGRVPASIVGDVTTMEFDGMICGAGSFIKINGDYIFEHYIERELLGQVMDCFAEHGVLFSLEAKNSVYQSPEISEFFQKKWQKRRKLNPEMARFHDRIRRGGNRLPLSAFDIRTERVAKLGFVCMEKERFADCVPFLSEQFQIVRFSREDEPYLNGEIFLKSCTKGDGVRRIVEYFRGDMEDTIGFGDSMNDYSMLEATAVGVCFEHAPEPLRELSSYYFKEPDEGGIPEVMKRMGLIRGTPND